MLKLAMLSGVRMYWLDSIPNMLVMQNAIRNAIFVTNKAFRLVLYLPLGIALI
jgi:hypothetical protein